MKNYETILFEGQDTIRPHALFSNFRLDPEVGALSAPESATWTGPWTSPQRENVDFVI